MEWFAKTDYTLEQNQKNYTETMKKEVKESSLGMSGIIKKHNDSSKRASSKRVYAVPENISKAKKFLSLCSKNESKNVVYSFLL